jgi:hypothetical protein
MVIGPPFLVLVVTPQGAASRRKVPGNFARSATRRETDQVAVGLAGTVKFQKVTAAGQDVRWRAMLVVNC